MSRAAVTAIIPTHNRRDRVTAAVGAIRGQRDVDLEIIVVDDGSQDGTAEALAARYGDDITILRHPVALGPSAARNDGVRAATTKWVAFCDDDDLWAPDKLARQLDAMGDAAHWSATGSVSVDERYRVIGHQRPPTAGDVDHRLQAHNVIPGGCSSVLAERDAVLEVGGFDTALASCEDYDLWCRLSRVGAPAVLDEPLVAYLVSTSSRSNETDDVRQAVAEIHRRYRRDLTPSERRRADLIDAQYQVRFPLRRGQRFAAAAGYLRIAWRFRLPSHVVHAGLALFVPAAAERHRAAVERREIPLEWVEAAEAWLPSVSTP